MTTSSLLRLPVELKLNILSNLPANETQRVREVCSDIRDVIEEPRNAKLLLQEAKTRAWNRLLGEMEYAGGHYENESFFDYLFRTLQLRGVWQLPSNTERLLFFFNMRWKSSVPAIEANVAADERGIILDIDISEALRKIGQALIQVHNNVHYPGLRRLVEIDNGVDLIKILTSAWIPELGTCAGLTKMEVGGWYQQLVNAQPGSTRIPCAPSACLAVADFILTTLYHWPQDREVEFDHPDFTMLSHGICLEGELSDLMGVELPLFEPFGYCIRTKWAFELVKAALANDRTLSATEQAAVLEHIYVF
ncbi:Putative F-box domain-containing protein [Septoria linicola]|uniref:F-box domain-containing protein n=1 Tax=Septoria linicola TaxID=215465 RepID=A0A9Q9AJ29_9PEZI|nr:Putative F-box domain-containing protein [Septoria linicola]